MNDQNILKRHLQPAARKLGLPFVNWRCLRTSHATWLVQAGADPKSVQGQMRHSRISTTMDIYAQIVPASQRRALQQLSVFAAGRSLPVPRPMDLDLDFSEPENDAEDHGPIHGPKRSNKAVVSMIENSGQDRQVTGNIGMWGYSSAGRVHRCNDEVVGSIPTSSTNLFKRLPSFSLFRSSNDPPLLDRFEP